MIVKTVEVLQDLRKSVSDSIQKGGDFDMINDDAKVITITAFLC